MLNPLKFDLPGKTLKVNQANVFYNYALGFGTDRIDLLKTGVALLEKGISQSVFFSDFKLIYIDEFGEKQVEIVNPKGRSWDPSWEIEIDPKIPKSNAVDLINSFEIAFHEKQIQQDDETYLRAFLPPIVLDDEDCQFPLFASVKIYADGIAIVSFQFDGTWDGLDENDFLDDLVNIYQRYFKSIWVDSKIQRLDSDILLTDAFEDKFSIAGTYFQGWKIKRLIKKMKKESQKVLDDAFQLDGELFNFGERDWLLHPIAGAKNDELWESTSELCRSIYCNAISSIIVPLKKDRSGSFQEYIWQGRPSLSLLSFNHQPKNKKELFQNFSCSMSKILLRANGVTKEPDLPSDLRLFDDYCLHANRSILLWTWLKTDNTLDDVWDDPNTPTKIFANQARTEQIEYYNMKVARACSWAHSPSSSNHLFNAYEALTKYESLIYHSSNSGEVTNALSYLLEQFGTAGVVQSAKEAARFYIDELKYQSDTAKNRSDRLLTVCFGLVGTTSLAEFVVHPFVNTALTSLNETIRPLISFGISGGLVLLIATIFIIFMSNNHR